MDKVLLGILLSFIMTTVMGQQVDDVIVTKIKTNYKVYFEGEELFETECAQCHGLKERVVSVGLADIHTKRSRAWLLEFLQKPQTLEYSNDPETIKYKEEYGVVNHTIIKHLTENDYNNILDFVASEMNGPTYDTAKVKEVYYVLQNKDIKVGDYKYYFPSGKLSHYYIYNNGLPWEVMEVYDVFGDKKDGGNLKNGTGTIIRYDKYGNKESATTYVRGFRSGEYKQYYDGGQLELLGYYSNGKANGKWTYYYTSGEVKNYITYRDGRIISNREGDKPDLNPGLRSPTNYSANPSKNTNKAPVVKSVSTVIYPYNETIRWENGEASNPTYTDLGNDLISKFLLKQQDELYINATVGFKRFHPPAILDNYVKELAGYGDFEFYRLESVGFTKVKGQQLVMLDYYLAYTHQNINMYVSYLLVNGEYKLDGWSFEPTNN